jgi:hypothetical protein
MEQLEEMPEMTGAELAALVWCRLRYIGSCSDVRLADIKIAPIKTQGTAPNWTATIDCLEGKLGEADAMKVVDELRGTYALEGR